MPKVPKVITESEPITEVTKIVQPVAQKNVAGIQINPATEDGNLASILAKLPAALTATGNLKQSLEESTIKQPTDIQDHYAIAVVLHASGAEIASGQSGDVDVGQFLYGETCIDVTAYADMASCDIIVEGKDETSAKYKAIHSFNATAVATNWLPITMLAFRLIRVRWVVNTPGAAPSITFSAALQGKC